MRPQRVLIHMDERRRDLAVLIALKQLLEDNGLQVTLSTRRTTMTYARQLCYDAILISTHGQILPSELSRIGRRSKIYLLPTEGALFGEWPLMVKYGGSHNSELWDSNIAGITRFFLWGEYSKRILLQTGRFRQEQLRVVGAQRLDFLLSKPTTQTSQSPEELGVLSNFVLTNSNLDMTIFQIIDRARKDKGYYLSPNRQIEDRYWLEAAWIRLWLELFDRSQGREKQLQLRIHPRENLDQYGYLQKQYGSLLQFKGQEVPFESWLEQIGILVGFNSTTFFEAVAAKKPTLNLEGLLEPRLSEHTEDYLQNHYPIMDFVKAPSTWEEFFNQVDQVRSGHWNADDAYPKEAWQLLDDVYSYPRKTSTLAAIVDCILQDLGETPVAVDNQEALRMRLGTLQAHGLEWATFGFRRDRVTSAWFPMNLKRFSQERAREVERYLEAAKAYPVTVATKDPDAVSQGQPTTPTGIPV